MMSAQSSPRPSRWRISCEAIASRLAWSRISTSRRCSRAEGFKVRSKFRRSASSSKRSDVVIATIHDERLRPREKLADPVPGLGRGEARAGW
jgi:hypothetical protein